MNVLSHFSIPYKGMGNGIHNLEFDVDDVFLKEFESSHLENGKFKVSIEFDKRSDHSVLHFDIEGYTNTSCDRCLEAIKLPMYGEYTLHLKHSEEGDNTDEIVYIHPETSVLNLASYVYEFVLLSMPIIKSYDCEYDEQPPCNFEILDKMDNLAIDQESEPTDQDSGIWSSLKDIKLDN